MNDSDRETWVDIISLQAEWRDNKAKRYRGDVRNGAAAAALRSLADYVANDEGESEGLKRLDGLLPGSETKQELGRYGFGYEVDEGTHEEMLTSLAARCVEEAYYIVKASEDNPPDDDDYSLEWAESMLHPLEIDLARQGVELSPEYFRTRRVDAEFEAELESLLK
jgi:hypothetical protein